jgi:CheY-like chemotaxis protein
MKSLTILVVEDHEDSARAMARLLHREGHSVTTASSFADALAAAARLRRIDVLVSDITLPDGNGCALLRLLMERTVGAPTHAIALTGHTENHWIEECRRAGFQRFLLKPVVFEELLAALRVRPAEVSPAVDAPSRRDARAT